MDDQLCGVVLCGGRGTRLMPLTKATNKQLLPVGGEPLCYHPVRQLVAAGISQILILTGPEHAGQIVNALGDGHELGADLTYRVQLEPKGIAHAIGLAESFVAGRRFVVLLGDNVFARPITSVVDRFRDQPAGARVVVTQVGDPSRFGVAVVEDGKIVKIVEKPDVPPSRFAVVGLYCYPPTAFDLIRSLEPSARGELEVTDLNNAFLPLPCEEWRFGWIDAGTPETLRLADDMLRRT